MAAIPKQREIIDRRRLQKAMAAAADSHAEPDSDECSQQILTLLKDGYVSGRTELQNRLRAGASGPAIMAAQSFLMDQLIRVLYDTVVEKIYPADNPTESEYLALVAVGGYGRGELAPYSDIDLLFLMPYKQTPWSETVVEYMLYKLFDLGVKVGYATRSVDDCLRLAKSDDTILTALLEARYLWGERPLFAELEDRFRKEIVDGKGSEFVETKLSERDARHKRLGDSRYVVEPNIKDGKGGLRDLHTLTWIAKYLYGIHQLSDLVDRNVLTKNENRTFRKADHFLRTVRCHLHDMVGRAEERLTFDMQPEIAARLGYSDDRPGVSGVERFMRHYYLTAKNVGDLTRIFCAAMEEQHRRQPLFRLPTFGLRRREVDGYRVEGGRITFLEKEKLSENPVRLIGLFETAHRRDLDIHPHALRTITRNLNLINAKLKKDPEANRLFLEVLTSKKNPESALRRMNEAGVFGRFIPDFGRVVAQMQHDLYHVYTVDEHTIRAIGILARIENGDYAEDHPLSADIIHKVKMRQVLYVAVLLHDIAKGRGGDHSVLGAEVANNLCPRLGLSAAETETVAWLVRWHLAMSNTSFKRDLDDPKTISDFVQLVQSPERLRLLLILTVADIRAVGPKIWNGWKGQLLRDLYHRAEEAMLGAQEGTTLSWPARIEHNKSEIAAKLTALTAAERKNHLQLGPDAFWLAGTVDTHVKWADMLCRVDSEPANIQIECDIQPERSVTEVTFATVDHPGLFSRLSGSLTLTGASILDARIFTLSNGMALDIFTIQDRNGAPFAEPDQLERLRNNIPLVLSGRIKLREALAKRGDQRPKRTQVFTVEPQVIIDNDASKTHTVIEVNGRDRPALLYDLTRTFYGLSLTIGNAQIATYGERAVDVFYVKDLFGMKITRETRLSSIREKLLRTLDPALTHDAERTSAGNRKSSKSAA